MPLNNVESLVLFISDNTSWKSCALTKCCVMTGNNTISRLKLFCLYLSISIMYFLNLFFIQQVLISHSFYTHQCIHVNPKFPVHPTTNPTSHRFPTLVSIRLISTSVSQFLSCKPVHMYHFPRFHIYVLIYDTYFSLSDLLHSV